MIYFVKYFRKIESYHITQLFDDTFAVFREIIHITAFSNYINDKYKSLIFLRVLENKPCLSLLALQLPETIILSLP